ncbi:hypothetical protein KAU09_03525 [Candidatus Parcubacteria bacterium]|nr:hypothetical protein [Candidatus Parcubacteria bacterium]
MNKKIGLCMLLGAFCALFLVAGATADFMVSQMAITDCSINETTENPVRDMVVITDALTAQEVSYLVFNTITPDMMAADDTAIGLCEFVTANEATENPATDVVVITDALTAQEVSYLVFDTITVDGVTNKDITNDIRKFVTAQEVRSPVFCSVHTAADESSFFAVKGHVGYWLML